MINSTVKYILFAAFLVTANLVLAGYDDTTYETKSEVCAELCGENGYMSSGGKPEVEGHSIVTTNTEHSAFSFVFLTWGFYIAYHIIAILLATIIFRNAKKRKNLALNLKPIWWGALVFIDPVLGILAYWVMNIIDVPGIIERFDKIQA